MAAGRAIVSADLPVIREVLNERNAIFCAPDDLENWRLEIERLLGDETRSSELGKRAREEVQSYTWLARAEKIVDGFPVDKK